MIDKGYGGVLEVDEESGELFGTVKGLRDVVTFVGATVEEARSPFEKCAARRPTHAPRSSASK